MNKSVGRFYDNKSMTSEEKETVITAINKLKETEDRIYQTEKRLGVLNNRQMKIVHKSAEKKRKQEIKEEVRKFAEQQKKIKNQYLMRMSFNIQKYHQKSEKERKQHKRKLESLKKQQYTQNNWTYNKIRQQRVENQRKILRQKKLQIEQKQKNRERIAEEELKRQKKNQSLKAQLEKHIEVSAIQNRLSERNRVLEYLQRQENTKLEASGLRERVNPEDILLSRGRSSFSMSRKSESIKNFED